MDGRWGWGEQECYREMVLISCDEEIGEYSGVRLGIMRSLFTIEQKLYCILSTEKKMYNLKIESYILLGGQNWGLKTGTQHLR